MKIAMARTGDMGLSNGLPSTQHTGVDALEIGPEKAAMLNP